MKRNLFLVLLLTAILCGMVSAVVYLNGPGSSEKKEGNGAWERPQTRRREAEVTCGAVTHTYRVSGSIAEKDGENCIETVVVENVTDGNFALLKERGEDIGAKEPLYKVGSKEQPVGYSARVSDIRLEENGETKNAVIRLLNYDKLCIRTEIDVDMLPRISYDTAVKVSYGGEEYPSRITYIGYRVENRRVSVLLELPKGTLPGVEAEAVFSLEVLERAKRAPADMFMQNGSSWFVNVLDGGKVTSRHVATGERFVDPQDHIEYMEILEGLEEGDRLVIDEIVNDSGKEAGE